MNHNTKYLFIFAMLILLFLLYNFNLYSDNNNFSSIKLSSNATEGETIWLNNNCNSCHQIYGLGGYIGPDLTNVYTRKGNQYIKSIINSGIKSMPKFNLNSEEIEQLTQFFKEIDESGYSIGNTKISVNGWVKINYKNNLYEN